MTKRRVIYLANQYSSASPDPDIAAYERAQRRILESFVGGRLRKHYNVALILPIALSASMSDVCSFGTGFAEWVEDDFAFIDRVDEVWVLNSPGVVQSVGVAAEIKYAQKIGKPINLIDIETLKQTPLIVINKCPTTGKYI